MEMLLTYNSLGFLSYWEIGGIMADINLRLIQQDSMQDRVNYFALQKSIALFPNIRYADKKAYEDKMWLDQFENKNRICYVIEITDEALYCGECAVKDISADVPEIEIELIRERQHQGIGYKAMIMLLNILSKRYGKQEFYVKIEPDNYASQFLFEKLRGMPVGLVRDYQISDERVEQFIKTHRYLLDERMQSVAKIFGVEADLLLTHLLVYKLSVNDLLKNTTDTIETENKREHIECVRKLSKEKYRDVVIEWIEDLEELENFGEAKDKFSVKIAEMKLKLLDKMKRIKMVDQGENGI